MKRSINAWMRSCRVDAKARGGRVLLLSAAAIVLTCELACGLAMGQSGSEPEKDDAVLRGPDVKDNSVPGNKGKFSGGGANDRQRREQAVSARTMMQAVEVLKKDSTPQADRLTDAQAKELKSVQDEFRASQKKFFEENREELVALRGKLSPEARRKVDERLRAIPGFNERPAQAQRGKKAKDDAKDSKKESDEMTSDSMESMSGESQGDQAAVLQRLKEIAAKSPDPKDAQTRSWAVLSASQKKLVEAEMQRIAKDRGGMPEQREMDRMPELKKDADGKIDISSLPPAMRERLEKLTPAERERALERIAERAKNRK
jgi:hypothetical protein